MNNESDSDCGTYNEFNNETDNPSEVEVRKSEKKNGHWNIKLCHSKYVENWQNHRLYREKTSIDNGFSDSFTGVRCPEVEVWQTKTNHSHILLLCKSLVSIFSLCWYIETFY